MQKNTIMLLVVAVILMAITTACSSKAANQKQNELKQKAAPAGLPVDVIVATESALDQTEIFAGSIVPNRSVEIMSELPKKITYVSFRDGSYVKQGQLLYRLDDADIHAKLDQLQAELNLAKINENRMRELLKTETVRREEYDIALSKLQSLQASQNILFVELSKTSVKAPFSGIIGISKVFAGTLVTPGMPMVTLQQQDILKVNFSVPEKYLPLIKPGVGLFFSTELAKEPLSATVVSTDAGIDLQSRNITVEAVTNNSDGKLKAGLSAKIQFKTNAENEKGIHVPTEALVPGGNGYSLFLVKNGLAKLTEVTVADRNEKEARISTGIKSGDTVLVSNILRVANGVRVTIAGVK